MPETEITLERIALIRRLVVAWNPEAHGAPMIEVEFAVVVGTLKGVG